MARRSLALLLACLLGVFAMSAVAQADTQDIIAPQNDPPSAADGWQAGTCNVPTCSPESADPEFFTQAGGHPPFAFTQYTIKQETVVVEGTPREIPVGEVGTIRVDLPPGLTVNPNATPVKCTEAEFNTPTGPAELPGCPEASKVGFEQITLKVVAGPGTGTPVAPIAGVTEVPVYNLVPEPGEPAKFGFKVGAPGSKEDVFLRTDVAWESDFHEGFTIEIPTGSPGTRTWKSRLTNLGATTGDGSYINTPTTCFDPEAAETEHLYSTWLRADSKAEVANGEADAFPVGYNPFEAKLPEGVGPTGCENVPFDPGIAVNPGTDKIDSPAPATVDTTLKYYNGAESPVQESHLRRAEATLPQGMGLNPAGAKGLVACTDAQFKKGVRDYNNACPGDSRIGTATIETPPLSVPLVGGIYAGTQNSMDPESGQQFRILVEAKEPNEGVAVRLVGEVKANKTTGQLSAVFDEQEVGQFAGTLPRGLPQVPFTSVKLNFGGKNVLTSPPTCAAAETTGKMEPWARPGEQVPVSGKFTLSSDPGGGGCPQTLAQRKFAPAYKAASNSTKAGTYSPFHVHIGRPDGQQELKVVNVTLPKGLTGKLAGIPYCSETEITHAVGNTGAAEKANPSCPGASDVGKAATQSGTGPDPLELEGDVYLAGPYKGAPLSLVTVTPATAGPFDLGVVVVRVALNVNPETGQINAVSDVIPDVFGGVKLDIRSINLNMNRPEFMLNPTNCAAQATTGTINGGGGNPADPAAFSSYAVNDPFQAIECNKLRFKPKLKVMLFGPTKRAKNPRLKAVLNARNGDANIARAALTLPHSLFLDQGHIGTVCTRPNLAAHTCPKASVYGSAEAKSPLLDRRLKGRVVLVPSNHKLPDLVADLRGQVDIQLRGVISSKRGGLKTVFPAVPDLPVSRFALKMRGGKKSLLVNSTNTCRKAQRAVLNLKGQNGKKVKNNKFRLTIKSCKKHKKSKKHKK